MSPEPTPKTVARPRTAEAPGNDPSALIVPAMMCIRYSSGAIALHDGRSVQIERMEAVQRVH